VGYNLTPNSKVYGNIAKVHRIPTFTDLYYVSKTERGNPDLRPENAFHQNGISVSEQKYFG
jgi:iron complex outermembrane receptor protein